MFYNTNMENDIRERFKKEFLDNQETKSKLYSMFSEQGVRLIGYRRDFINSIITVSVAFIVAPRFLNIIYNNKLYITGLLFLIINIIIALLHLRESIDTDEKESFLIMDKLIPILDRRIEKIKEYLSKYKLSEEDLNSYNKYRKEQDYGEDMTNLEKENSQSLKNISLNKINHPTAFLMFLFTSGIFFIFMSVLFKYICIKISIIIIILVEIFLIFITATDSSNEIFKIYAKFIKWLKSKLL